MRGRDGGGSCQYDNKCCMPRVYYTCTHRGIRGILRMLCALFQKFMQVTTEKRTDGGFAQ